MDNNFAKLFQLDENNQVLITKELDEESELPKIRVTIEYVGINFSYNIKYTTEEKRDKMFNDFTMDLAAQHSAVAKKMLDEALSEDEPNSEDSEQSKERTKDVELSLKEGETTFTSCDGRTVSYNRNCGVSVQNIEELAISKEHQNEV